MFGFGVGEMPPLRLTWFLTPEVRLALLAGIVGSMPIVPALAARAARAARPSRGLAAEFAGALALVAVFLAALLQVGARSYNPFIYFRF
jgi:hypothetical protein